MATDNPPITTMRDFLEALTMSEWNSRKCLVEVISRHDGVVEVVQHFDDGKGHSGAFTSEYIPLDRGVFEEARGNRYITGVLKPGYVSSTDFRMTTAGEEALSELRAAEKAG